MPLNPADLSRATRDCAAVVCEFLPSQGLSSAGDRRVLRQKLPLCCRLDVLGRHGMFGESKAASPCETARKSQQVVAGSGAGLCADIAEVGAYRGFQQPQAQCGLAKRAEPQNGG